jgi:hypothetical protein
MASLQDAMNTVWDVPIKERPNFLEKRGRAILLLSVLGLGFFLAAGLFGASSFRGGYAWGAAASLVVDFLRLLRCGHRSAVMDVHRRPTGAPRRRSQRRSPRASLARTFFENELNTPADRTTLERYAKTQERRDCEVVDVRFVGPECEDESSATPDRGRG